MILEHKDTSLYLFLLTYDKNNVRIAIQKGEVFMWEQFYQKFKRKKDIFFQLECIREFLDCDFSFQEEFKNHFQEVFERIAEEYYTTFFIVIKDVMDIEPVLEQTMIEKIKNGRLPANYEILKDLYSYFPKEKFPNLKREWEASILKVCKRGEAFQIEQLLYQYPEIELTEEHVLGLIDGAISSNCENGKSEIYRTMAHLLIEEMKNLAFEDKNVYYLGTGCFSTAIRIGNLVLKAGMPGCTKIDISSKYFPFSYFNKTYKEDNIHIELMDYVNTELTTVDDVYELYRNFKMSGLIWTDTKKANVGKYDRNRERTFSLPNRKARMDMGIENELSYHDSTVLIDKDLLFQENDSNISGKLSKKNHLVYEYEMRYQLEKQGIIFETMEEFKEYLKEKSREKRRSLHKMY